nr:MULTISPECIES: DUF1918 domain-containing protein [unclassified Streptomyces]
MSPRRSGRTARSPRSPLSRPRTPGYSATRWSDTGRTTVFFPGPDAHVRQLHDETGTPRHGEKSDGAVASR